ncbi:MAG: dihydropteroate synthase [Deltaproteobacteria bacterium]|nr:dihydropteroate synthase [Deltaproteobacteria bacterium]
MSLLLPDARLGQHTWALKRAYVFGVINTTPDSFSDGGQFFATQAAVEHGIALAAAGADALDIGGESTRPGAGRVSVEEELRRVLPVVEALNEKLAIPISIDTTKAEVARQAVAAGACIVNDISGMALDEKMAETVASLDVAVILGHLRGEPATMQDGICFKDVVAEVADELREQAQRAIAAGIQSDRIWIDPGIGFGKTTEQSVALIAATGLLRQAVGHPIMVGPSRKSFIGTLMAAEVSARQQSTGRIMGTAAAVAVAITLGADAVRIHDVRELHQAVVVSNALRSAYGGIAVVGQPPSK